ncbi:MAG: dihydrodipicolinate synthase family protein [Pseudonocardia sp.]
MIVSPIVAVVTPFDAQGAVDEGALRSYLAFLSAAGVRTIFVNGTTGEFFTMTVPERRAVLELCREHWSGQVIAHIGSASVGDALDLLDHARSRADYVAVIAPYYFASPPEEGVRAYFRQLLVRSDLPLLLYNFPRHTQTAITPSVVSQLAAEFPLLRGVKDSGKDRDVTRQFKAARPDMQVFVGDDRAAAHLAEIGADGIVTGGGGPVVEIPLRIAGAVQGGDLEHARQLQVGFDRWTDARHASPLTEIAFTKAALAARLPGFPPHVRPPLVTATDSQCEEARSLLRRQMMLPHRGEPARRQTSIWLPPAWNS